MSSGKVRSLCLVSLHFAPFLYTLIYIQIHTPLQILCSLILQYRFIRHILCTKRCAIKWTNNLVRLNYMKRMKGLWDYILYIFRLPPLYISPLWQVIYLWNFQLVQLFKYILIKTDSLHILKFTLGKQLTLYQPVGTITEVLCMQTSKHSSQLYSSVWEGFLALKNWRDL